MWEILISPISSFVSSIVSSLISSLLSREKKPGLKEEYKNIRFEISYALTMYAQYYHNPVDLARMPNHKLPPEYADASRKIRELASKTRAVSETISNKRKNTTDLYHVSECLYGISNSFATPYHYGNTVYLGEKVERYENEIRTLLNLSSGR